MRDLLRIPHPELVEGGQVVELLEKGLGCTLA
jgi:hypothetical protein